MYGGYVDIFRLIYVEFQSVEFKHGLPGNNGSSMDGQDHPQRQQCQLVFKHREYGFRKRQTWELYGKVWFQCFQQKKSGCGIEWLEARWIWHGKLVRRRFISKQIGSIVMSTPLWGCMAVLLQVVVWIYRSCRSYITIYIHIYIHIYTYIYMIIYVYIMISYFHSHRSYPAWLPTGDITTRSPPGDGEVKAPGAPKKAKRVKLLKVTRPDLVGPLEVYHGYVTWRFLVSQGVLNGRNLEDFEDHLQVFVGDSIPNNPIIDVCCWISTFTNLFVESGNQTWFDGKSPM